MESLKVEHLKPPEKKHAGRPSVTMVMTNSWFPYTLRAVSNFSHPPVEVPSRWVLTRFGETLDSEVVEDGSHVGIIRTVELHIKYK